MASAALRLMVGKLLQQAISVAGMRVVGTGLGVLISIAIARVFGAEELGIYGYCMALLAIAGVPIANGWSTMLLRSVSKQGSLGAEAREMARRGALGAVGFAMIAAGIGWAAIMISSSAVADALRPLGLAAIALLAVTLLCDQISALRMASLRGIDRPVMAQLPESTIRPLVLLLGIAAFWAVSGWHPSWPGLFALFVVVALAATLSAVVGHAILKRYLAPVLEDAGDFNHKGWIASAGALAGSAGLVQLNGYVDLLLLGAYAGATELGHYRAALQIAMLTSFGYFALNLLASQRFARLRDGDRAELAATARYLSRLALLTAIPVPLALLLVGQPLLELLFGSGFSDAATPALIVSCGLSVSSATGMAHALLVMHGHEFLAIRATFAALLLNIALCLILIPDHGTAGAALSNLAATGFWNCLLWLLARRRTGIDTSALGLASRPQQRK